MIGRTARRCAFAELVVEGRIRARVQLWSDGFYATPKLHWDKATMSGRPFFYFAYGAAVSRGGRRHADRRVEAACAPTCCTTPATRINPAIDIGQVEGAFIQGMGWLTTEELVWWNDGAAR